MTRTKRDQRTCNAHYTENVASVASGQAEWMFPLFVRNGIHVRHVKERELLSLRLDLLCPLMISHAKPG